MKFNRLLIVSSAVALASIACAKDPNTEVKSSRAELTSEQQKAQHDQSELSQKQASERASNPPRTSDDAAEMNAKHAEERAETRADGQRDVSGAKKDVTHAHENMDTDRRDFDTKSKERLTKLDARAQEMKSKSAKLDAKKKNEFNTYYTRFTSERSATTKKIQNLSAVSNDGWDSAKKDVEASLDQMEKSLDKLEKDL